MATGGADYSAARIAPHEGRRSACREAQRTKLTGCERTARKRRRRAVRLSEWLGSNCPPDCYFIGQATRLPTKQLDTRGSKRLVFLCVAGNATFALVRRVVKFNYGNDGGVLLTDDEIGTHSIYSIQPTLRIVSLLHAEKTRQLHLCQHDMVGQCADQAKVQNLLWRRKWTLCIERPFTAQPRAPSLDEERDDKHCDDNDNRRDD